MAYKFGNEPYIIIDNIKWQRRNLDVSTYRNGDIIPYIIDATIWSSLTTGAWCWYNNDPELGKIYGKLYNWHAVNDPRGLALEGWHISTTLEWDNLYDALGKSSSGGAIKETGYVHWDSPNTGATNISKFTALPGGHINDTGIFELINKWARWWTPDEEPGIPTQAKSRATLYNSSNILTPALNKNYGLSVRCVKDQ